MTMTSSQGSGDESLQHLLLKFVARYKLDTYSFQPLVWRRSGPVDPDSGPVPRSGHRLVYHNDCLYSYGGYSPLPDPQMFKEIWEYDIFKETWFKKTLTGSQESKAASAYAVVVNQTSGNLAKLLVFGGTDYPFGLNLSNKIYLFDLKTFNCVELRLGATTVSNQVDLLPRADNLSDDDAFDGAGSEYDDDDDDYMDIEEDEDSDENMPRRGYGHAMIQVRDKKHGTVLYCIGGTVGTDYNMDVHMFSFRDLKWQACYITRGETTRAPHSRYRHELAQYKTRIFVLGGGTDIVQSVFDFMSLWCFDTTRKGQTGLGDWVSVTALPDPTCPITESATEQFPAPRKCHDCVQHGKYAYVFGGFDGSKIFGDVWRLDLEHLQWKQLPSNLPAPAYFGCSTISPSGQIFQFGGVVSLNGTRTNKIHSMWTGIPTLREMSWQAVLHYLPHLSKQKPEVLMAGGIPGDLVKSLSFKSQQR